MSEKEKDLPEELIHQILLRLPVKSLLRFKCVCKSWLSIISNPQFAKSHFDLAAAPSHRLMLTQRFGSVFGSLDLDASFDDYRAPPLELHFIVGSLDLDASFDDHRAPSLEVNFKLPISREPIRMILGSCRGFLLLESLSNLLLWNPSTGVHRQLPLPPVFSFLFGFGYDESRDDYLVVQGWHDQEEVDVLTHIDLFSVRANAWRKIESTRFAYKNYARFPKAGSFLNGAIHWLVCRGDGSEPVIIAFDLMERNFTEIPLPDGGYPNENSYVRVLGGCLCLTTDAFYGFPYPVEIWVMKQYKVQSSWTKPTFETFIEDFSPVCFNKSGDLQGIGGSKGPTGLVKCNGKGEIREYANYHYGCEAAVYTESLLSLPDGSGQAGNGNQQ